MKIPQMKPGYKHFEKAPIVQLSLLKKFCELNKIKISDRKLFQIFNKMKYVEGKNGY